MRQIAIKLIPVIVVVLLCSPLFAEAVFLNDGTIVEGKIVKDTGIGLVLKMSDGPDTSIPRASVLRVLYHEDYKKAVSLHKADGKVVRGFIVEENKDDYVLRKDLNSPAEITIKKNDVNAIIIIKEEKEKKSSPESSKSNTSSIKTSSRPASHSVALAVFTSSFPIWSGSFNDGFQPIDGLGITFVILKSASVIAGGVLFGVSQQNPDLGMAIIGIFCLGIVWPAITIGDQIFSGVIMHKNNKARGTRIANDNESTVDFALYPRMNYMYDRTFDPQGMYGSIDSGVNIAVVCRW